jgi:glycosyltransferase involved in cell wall biosynthesis
VKILTLHSYYRQRGGEDAIFEQEAELMAGTEEVRILAFRNRSGIRGIAQFALSIWNIRAARKIKKAIQEFHPDAIHLHNWHFGIGPLAIRVAKTAGIPIVLTINNYRLLCPSATFLVDGRLFTDSLTAGFPWKAIAKGAYRHSMILSFWLAFIVWFHKKTGTWKMVDRFIVNTDFARSLFDASSFGIPAERFVVKSNFVTPPNGSAGERRDHILFVGRLSEEKGIAILLDAFRHTNYQLHIAGDGPLKELVRQASLENPNIRFLGPLDRPGVQLAMQECKALVFPSIWYEGMPMTIIESFAAGTPVIASNIGAMGSMIRHGYNGLHFEKGDSAGLQEQLDAWYNMERGEIKNYHSNTLDTYKAHYTAEKNKEQLIHIYKNLLYAEAVD